MRLSLSGQADKHDENFLRAINDLTKWYRIEPPWFERLAGTVRSGRGKSRSSLDLILSVPIIVGNWGTVCISHVSGKGYGSHSSASGLGHIRGHPLRLLPWYNG